MKIFGYRIDRQKISKYIESERKRNGWGNYIFDNFEIEVTSFTK